MEPDLLIEGTTHTVAGPRKAIIAHVGWQEAVRQVAKPVSNVGVVHAVVLAGIVVHEDRIGSHYVVRSRRFTVTGLRWSC